MVDMLTRKLGKLTVKTESRLRWETLALMLIEKGLSGKRCEKLTDELFVLFEKACGL
jgi:hypothetical protein